MNKSKMKVLSMFLLLALLLSACAPPSGETGNNDKSQELENNGEVIVRTNNGSEPGSLDPALAQGTHEAWVLDHTFEGLMKIDEDLNVVPGMAESYELSDDDLVYTFKLRDGIKWSNGEDITAEDFAYSWTRVLDPTLGSDYAYQLYYIKGGEAFNSVKSPGVEYTDPEDETKKFVETYDESELEGLDVEGKSEDEINQLVYNKRLEEAKSQLGLKVLDEKTLEVTLEAPTAYFLELTAFYTLYPVNKSVAESDPNWAKNADTHVSNGPFELVTWEHSAKIKIRKNENYYDKDRVKIDGIDFDIIDDENTAWQKYEGGDYDILTPLPQGVVAEKKAQGDEEIIIAPQVGTYYYNFNLENEVFQNENIRKGIAMTLDRQTIVDKIAQGGQIPAVGVVPDGLIDDNGVEFREDVGDLLVYDVEKGKELFEKGLEEEGLTKDDFKNMVILYNTAESHKKIAQAAQEMWRVNLGIELQLENVDFQVKLDREKAGDFDISRGGWLGDYMDPITFIELWESNSSFNDAGYNNKEYDELVKLVKSTADQKIRFDAMKKAEKILMNDMPIIPVYFYTQPFAQKTYLTGVYKPLVNYPRLTYAEINR